MYIENWVRLCSPTAWARIFTSCCAQSTIPIYCQVCNIEDQISAIHTPNYLSLALMCPQITSILWCALKWGALRCRAFSPLFAQSAIPIYGTQCNRSDIGNLFLKLCLSSSSHVSTDSFNFGARLCLRRRTVYNLCIPACI